MKRILTAAVVTILSTAAMAQVPAANPAPAMPATNNPDTNKPAQPAAGANSFTEAQAKARIEEKGFMQVSGLQKDKDGIWRGKAMKGNTSHDVALDYQGHVFPN
ncbi:MAG TPA: PepSY domain-containing protein [Xanthobacteraceae bacterium]|nr:PepSY domain-containing protein [Xanthobacteraceae bacterium]